jgi:alpha-mannosidase
VFNPHAWPSRVPVEIEFGRLAPEDILLDDAGHPVSMQTTQSDASTRNRYRLNFIADLPPLGYRVYRVAPGPTPPAPLPTREGGDAVPSCPGRGGGGEEVFSLETPRFRLALDPATGCIASLYDKAHNTQVFLGQAAQPVVIDDPSDTWSHNVYRFDHVIGAFTPRRIRLVEDGPVKSVLRVESVNEGSTLVQDFTVYQDLDRVAVAVTVDWHGQHQMLKLRFPTNIAFQKVTAEIPYGHIERFANGDEQPGQSWVDVSGESRDSGELYGVSIINDGKYSFDANLRDIGLTVLRSPIYAHHMPYTPQPDRDYTYMDQGLQHFTYTILPHAGSWEDAGTVRRASELNGRPAVLPATFHVGVQATLPQSASFLSVDRDNIVVSVLKQAEDGAGVLILRAYEAHKMATHARICLPYWDRVIEADFGPCEIKTFRMPRDRSAPVEETDLLEWTINEAHPES